MGQFGRCIASDIAIESNIDALDGGVDLVQDLKRRMGLAALLTGVKMHGTGVSIVGAHLRIRWVKRSADTDRESLGKLGPAFVSDLLVPGHVQACQARVHLQEVDRKSMVSGAANQAQNTWKIDVEGSQQR